jgi:DNA-binding MarR family transcriptional regulator
VRPAEELRYLVLAAQREGNRQLSAQLKPLGLTPAQAEALRIIGDNDAITLTGLGELLVCESGTNPSRIADRLVSAGLVDRVVDVDDRRRVVLTLTDAGLAQEKKVRAIEELMYEQIDALGPQPEVVVFLRALVEGQPSGEALARRRG